MSLAGHPLSALFGEVPEDGIMVRDEGSGFHARVHPSPGIRWVWIVGAAAVWAALCAVMAVAVGGPQVLLFSGGMLFGSLLGAVHIGRGYMPIELAVSDNTLYIDGERRPLSTVGGVELRGNTLVVLGLDQAVIGTIDGVSEEVGRWIQRAVQHLMANPVA
jgi:hypothetical protein